MTAATDWLTTDHYAVLGVPNDASAQQITRAYRRLARELHPDTRPGGRGDDQFRQVAAAYAVLGHEATRKEYDEARTSAVRRVPGGTSGGVRVRVRTRGRAPADDVTAGRAPSGRRGRDLRATVRLDAEPALRGTTVEIPVDRSVTCPSCGGTGAAPGGAAVCRTCRGSGVQRTTRTVAARLPAGMVDGQSVRLPGRGEAGVDGGPAGDLLVEVRTDPHPLFGRDGRRLTLTLPVGFVEAVLGADITVPTLAAPVTVRIPPGTASGTTLRVRGRGVPAGSGEPAGDLLVTVDVVVPRHLTEEERAAVEQLAAVSRGSPRAHLGI